MPATLLTGLKRDMELLKRVPANAGNEVNVFDLSMQRNRAALMGLLDVGVRWVNSGSRSLGHRKCKLSAGTSTP